jgi:NADPH2:quinone reductase
MTQSPTPDSIALVQLARTGGPEVLELVRRPLPQPAAHEVRVRAEAIGVGKPDALIRKGSYAWMPPLPAVPGNEMAGCVEALGSAVTHLRLGQRVLVSARELPQRGGCYAEAICVPAHALYVLPDAVSSVDAVSLGNYQLAGALLYASGIQRPRSLLIHGAAGGVGTAVLQLAAADGLLAIGTVSSDDKYAYAQAAGARHLIHRGHQSVQAEVMALTAGRGVDLVLDHVAGPGFGAQLDMLAPLGTLLSYNALGGLPSENLLGELRRLLGKSLGVRCYSIHTLDQAPEQRRALMERSIELMASGALRPAPPTLLSLQEAQQAHTLLDAGQTLGKLVLLPQR